MVAGGCVVNRINIICLGVKDMAESIRFYRDGLGFVTDEARVSPPVVFFSSAGTKLELYPINLLAQDINEDDPPPIAHGFAGITLAYNARSVSEVDSVVQQAILAGATVAKSPRNVFWGGYSGYFIDPNGYYWEVAFNPEWKFDDTGMLLI
jgi:hypothetical protein